MAACNSPRVSTEGSEPEVDPVVPLSTSGPSATVVHNAAAAKNAAKKKSVLEAPKANSVSVLQGDLEAAKRKGTLQRRRQRLKQKRLEMLRRKLKG